MSVPWYLMAKGKGGGGYKTASGPIVSISDALAAPLRSLRIGIDPVQAGTGDPSPDNVRPISGWTEANLWRTGKNLFDISQAFDGTGQTITGTTISKGSTGYYFDLFNGTIGSSSIAVKKLYLKAGTYTLSGTYVGRGNLRVYITDASGAAETTHIAYINSSNSSTTFTLAEDSYSTLRYSAQDEATITNLQIELGSTATAYEPYQGDTYTIQLGQTVYGGTLDVTNGVLRVDRVIRVLNDKTKWRTSSGTQDFEYNDNAFRDRRLFDDSFTGLICSCYPAKYGLPSYVRWTSASGYDIGVKSSTITLEELQNLSESGQFAISYPIATPQTVQLTPTEVQSLIGENNVWADCGDVTVEYVAAGGSDPSLMKLAIALGRHNA